MIIQCESCSRKFIVKDNDIPKEGRTVRCGYCSVTWHQMPAYTPVKNPKKQKTVKSDIQNDDTPSVDSMKASDGKTYKFLGTQWAELLPSGKTGLFARKKISQELDKITGRKERKSPKKKKKKITEVNPSSENISNENQLPDIYKPKEGLGFFGYIFLIIIVTFSIVGVLKTFENDLINSFPETEYLFTLLNEQLNFFSETTKNMITIVKDLINPY
tara:strand:- start:679 stop:1326 length:648 start_codon:yes stop_codon:yes gene_type:complete